MKCHDTPHLQAAMRRHENLHKRGPAASILTTLATILAGLAFAAALAHFLR
jgi:hypothetical protein